MFCFERKSFTDDPWTICSTPCRTFIETREYHVIMTYFVRVAGQNTCKLKWNGKCNRYSRVPDVYDTLNLCSWKIGGNRIVTCFSHDLWYVTFTCTKTVWRWCCRTSFSHISVCVKTVWKITRHFDVSSGPHLLHWLLEPARQPSTKQNHAYWHSSEKTI